MADILIGYSTCPLTRQAFEKHGHNVWTCDRLPARDGHPNHYQCDIWDVLGMPWDMAVLHPMCTYLTVSAAWALKDADFDKYPGVGYHQRVSPGTLIGEARRCAQAEALDNFCRLLALPYAVAIENPAPSFVSKAVRPPSQIIQPNQFGDDASKSTGLWLKDLPLLVPTQCVPGRIVTHNGKQVERWANQTDSGQNKLTPSDTRWLERSKTYPGIAAAMGDQWGRLFDATQRPQQLNLTLEVAG
jgi:hypothetical protein